MFKECPKILDNKTHVIIQDYSLGTTPSIVNYNKILTFYIH